MYKSLYKQKIAIHLTHFIFLSDLVSSYLLIFRSVFGCCCNRNTIINYNVNLF